MNALRHPAFQRAVAALLLAGAGVACMPVAVASTRVEVTHESDLRAALGDSEAFDRALDAARQASTPAAAADAFVRSYAAATGDAIATRDLAQLVLDHADFGAPVLPRSEAVWSAASGTPPLLDRTASAVLRTTAPDGRAALAAAVLVPAEARPVFGDTPSPQRTRAP